MLRIGNWMLAVAATVPVAGWAGAMEDCVQIGDSALRMSGCTEVIESGAEGKQLALAFLLRGTVFAGNGEHGSAVGDFTEAIALETEMPIAGDAVYSRARSHAAMGDAGAALADFDRAVELAPKHPIYLNFRGEFLLGQGNASDALADFEAAMKVDVMFFPAWVNQGRAFAAMGNVQGAVYYWENVMGVEGPRRVRWFQEHLAEHGHYEGPVDGEITPDLVAGLEDCARDAACRW
jgi:tetratricopeptide (TPR) repeat protein